jgi:hypothetical protein
LFDDLFISEVVLLTGDSDEKNKSQAKQCFLEKSQIGEMAFVDAQNIVGV